MCLSFPCSSAFIEFCFAHLILTSSSECVHIHIWNYTRDGVRVKGLLLQEHHHVAEEKRGAPLPGGGGWKRPWMWWGREDGGEVFLPSDSPMHSKKMFLCARSQVPPLTKHSLPSSTLFFPLTYKQRSLAFIKGLNVSQCHYNQRKPNLRGGQGRPPGCSHPNLEDKC